MKNYVIELFYGKKAPIMRKTYKNTIFIPKDSNYPAFDVFYYDKDKDSLFCFQITIKN
jgi:hypothetical protein